jgi:phosphocarrier protein
MRRIELEVINKLGLHARAAAKVVHTASRFSSDIVIGTESEEVNAKSILGLLTLAASQGANLHVTADGQDEDEAVEALGNLFSERFGEEE